MKLKELTGYKQDPFYIKAVEIFKNYRITTAAKLDAFSNYMKEQGFHILGSGVAGIAFEKEGYPWVFKLFHDDDGYVEFFNYAKAHQNNPHVPRTKGGIMKLTSDPLQGNLYLVRIERLHPLPIPLQQDKIIQLICSLSFPDEFVPAIQKDIARQYPDIIPVIKDILNSSHAVDFSIGNLMLRGKTLVITDPLLG